MRRGALVIGVLVAVALAGCGGSGTPSSSMAPSLTALRAEIRHSVDSKSEKLGRPAKEIACVDRNIAAMNAGQLAERLVEAAPANTNPGDPKAAATVTGPLGRGCP